MSEEAKQSFIRIQEAFETLIDPQKRKIYDEYGTTGVKFAQEHQLDKKYSSSEKARNSK